MRYLCRKIKRMRKKSLYQFNIALIVIAMLTAISSILLEGLQGEAFLGINFRRWVWIHIIVCFLSVMVVAYHLYLHWNGMSQWLRCARQINAISTKWLMGMWSITFLSGIMATILFWNGIGHNTIGGIHGKFGLIAIGLTIFHLYRRFRWFNGRRSGRAFGPIIDVVQCIGCGKCVKHCPAKVFTKKDKQVLVLDVQFCQQCMRCVKNCPKKAISPDNHRYN